MAKVRLKVEQIGDVTMVQFLDKRIRDEAVIDAIGEQLFGLVEEGRRNLLLNFSGVEYLSSAALGKLIKLHKDVNESEGELGVCNLIPHVFDVFAITKLDKMFTIYADEGAGLAALKRQD
jgi:anti-sigma B factor antagonist